MTKKKKTFMSEDEHHEWVEHSGRKWIFFGETYNYWRIIYERHGSIAAQIGNIEYQRVREQQRQNSCNIATFETYNKDEKISIPGWKRYWFMNSYSVAELIGQTQSKIYHNTKIYL